MPCLRLPVLLAVVLAATPLPALADDLADEADLHFRLGADRYQRGDFNGALEHFLVSNRLVPNRNVLFNIARSFEKSGRFADAHRYYTQVLEGERDPAQRARVEAELARLAPNVAVLRIVTDPPGATIYIDRKDLGPRGNAPRKLAFAPGTYRVLAELPDHEPATSDPVLLALGKEVEVSLKLARIFGRVQVEGTPGARVFVGGATEPAGTVPTTLELPPGTQTLRIELAGHRSDTQLAEVKAGATVVVRTTPAPLTGTVRIEADEPNALIEIDGKARGFAPAVIPIEIGTRTVRVSRPGFHPVEQTLELGADEQRSLSVELRPVEEVTAASRVTESVDDAPASVSVISRQELRAMAYPTVAEALRGTRGIFVSDDRTYVSLGFRGLSLLGDYGNRVLVLLDGTPMNDDWIGSSYVSYDFRSDLDDVERIEVVRGAGSVLYGTGAVSGVVNVVTRGRDVPEGVEFGVGASAENVGRGRIAATTHFGEDAGLWLATAYAHGGPTELDLPELADPATGFDGQLRDRGAFDAGTLSGRAWAGDLSAIWHYHSRLKDIATAQYGAIPNLPGNEYTDTRGLFELRFEPELTDWLTSLSRAGLHYYHYRSDLNYPLEDGGDSTNLYDGSWVMLEQRFVFQLGEGLRLTAGGEGQFHLQARMTEENEFEKYLDRDDSFQTGAGYLLLDAELARWCKVSAGARLDAYSTFGSSLNPRLSLIFRPWDGGTLKAMGGKAFRAPSIFELYYAGGGNTQVASPDLGPETLWSGELELSQRLSNGFVGTVAGFFTRVNDLVSSAGAGTAEDPLHYVNSDAPVEAIGGELELRREWRQGVMAAASYSFQRSRFVDDTETLREVANSPNHLASLRAAAPLVSRAVTAATRLSFEGPRFDRFENGGDPPQLQTDPALLWDVVLSGASERVPLRWAAGVYNLLDQRWRVPASREHRFSTVEQSGRTLLVSATVSL